MKMSIKEVTEVCRLCLKNEDLNWVFDKKNTENLKDVILVATGVQVELSDVVSQKICTKCLQVSYKILKFRTTSSKNDAYLKEKYKEFTKDKVIRTPNSNKGIKVEEPLPHSCIHPSVLDIRNKFPDLRVPKICLGLDISPYISLQMNEVESYFMKPNLDIQEQIRYAYKTLRVNSSNAHRIETKLNEAEATQKNLAISPINIKLTNNDKKEYTVIKKDDKIMKAKHDLKRSFDTKENSRDSFPSTSKIRKLSENSSDSLPRTSKIRKLSETNNNMEEKSCVIRSLGLTPTKAKLETDGLVNQYVHRTLEICNICASVHYNLKELKKHQQRHLRCQFCKTKFKSMDRKQEHIKENCVTKKMMSSLPTIDLSKIEFDKTIRRKYPNAFITFRALPELDNKDSNTQDNSKDHDCSKINLEVVADAATNQSVMDDNNIIEILSDDEDLRIKNSCAKENCEKSKRQTALQCNSSPSGLTTISYPPTSVQKPSSSTDVDNPPTANSSFVPSLSSSIVKPDIKIKNNCVLDMIDPKSTDLIVLKDLLKSYRKLQPTKDVGVQQELPSNSSIKTNPHDYVATLKDFKQQLYLYKIPVEVKYGTYKVSFDYNPPKKKKTKMYGWSLLTPIDLKTPTATKNNSSMNKNNATSSSNVPQINQPTHLTSDITTKNGNPMNNNKILPSNLTFAPTPKELVATANSSSSLQVVSPSYSSSLSSTKHSYVTKQSNVILQTPTSKKSNSNMNKNNATLSSSNVPQVDQPIHLTSDITTKNGNPMYNNKVIPTNLTLSSTSIELVATENSSSSMQVLSSLHSSSISSTKHSYVTNQGNIPEIDLTISSPLRNISLNKQVTKSNTNNSPQVNSSTNSSSVHSTKSSFMTSNENITPQISSTVILPTPYSSSAHLTKNSFVTSNENMTPQISSTMHLPPPYSSSVHSTKNSLATSNANMTPQISSTMHLPPPYSSSFSSSNKSHLMIGPSCTSPTTVLTAQQKNNTVTHVAMTTSTSALQHFVPSYNNSTKNCSVINYQNITPQIERRVPLPPPTIDSIVANPSSASQVHVRTFGPSGCSARNVKNPNYVTSSPLLSDLLSSCNASDMTSNTSSAEVIPNSLPQVQITSTPAYASNFSITSSNDARLPTANSHTVSPPSLPSPGMSTVETLLSYKAMPSPNVTKCPNVTVCPVVTNSVSSASWSTTHIISNLPTSHMPQNRILMNGVQNESTGMHNFPIPAENQRPAPVMNFLRVRSLGELK